MESPEEFDAAIDIGESNLDTPLKIEITETIEIKEIVTTLLEKCKKECDNNELEIPLQNYVERVSFYTGYTTSVLRKFIENEKYFLTETCSIPPSGRIEIYKSVRDFYLKEISPTMENVFEDVKTQINIATLDEFKREMLLMGYNYRNTPNSKILMEDPNITFKRFFYLNKMNKIHQKDTKSIYYIDERLVDSSLTFPKVWLKNIDVSSTLEDGYVFLYLSSKNTGYVTGLFCDSVTADDFKKWISDMILSLLDPGSVVVMNDTPLHKDNNDKPLSKYDTKEEMLQWLRKNNIPCTRNMHKTELYELTRRCSKQVKKCKIDQLLQAHGHEVLWLPLCLHDFPPTEGLWTYTAQSLRSEINPPSLNNKNYLNKLTTTILKTIANISQDYWNKLVKDAMKQENELYEIDATVESFLDKILSNKV